MRARRALSRLLASLSDRLSRAAAAVGAREKPLGQEDVGLLREVIDLLPHPIAIRDEKQRFVLANRALAARYGSTSLWLEGRTEAELSSSAFRGLCSGGGSAAPIDALEEAWTDAAGEGRVFWTHRVPFRQRGRRIVLSVSVDVTESKRAQEDEERRLAAAVEAAGRPWRNTFDSMHVALVVLGADGRVLRANRTAADGLSQRIAHLPGQRWGELARDEPWLSAARLADAARANGRRGHAEVLDPESATA